MMGSEKEGRSQCFTGFFKRSLPIQAALTIPASFTLSAQSSLSLELFPKKEQ
jgi:hypothetical protein